MNILDEKREHIKEAIAHNLYNLDAETFFIEKIISAIKNAKTQSKLANKTIERKFFKSYLTLAGTQLNPTEKLLKEINFIADESNKHLQSELISYVDRIFTPKTLLYAINNSTEKMAKLLSIAMREKIDKSKYNVESMIENVSTLNNEINRAIFIKEITLTQNTSAYIIIEKALNLDKEKKELIVKNILIKNTEAILLNRNIIKKLFMKPISKNHWKTIDTYIENISITKFEFLIDIFKEIRNETDDKDMSEKINKLIYKTIERAMFLKEDALINRVIEMKKEQKDLTQFDMYVLMIKRVYSYFKKEQAQQYVRKILEVANDNGDLENIKNFLFGQEKRYKIEPLDIEVNIGEQYFKNEMKQHFMSYLTYKLPVKNNKVKASKI